MGGELRLAPAPGSVGDEAANHPRQDAEGDAAIARPVSAGVRDVVMQVGVESRVRAGRPFLLSLL
jgi:hypothetical protein